jgi:MFS family permease
MQSDVAPCRAMLRHVESSACHHVFTCASYPVEIFSDPVHSAVVTETTAGAIAPRTATRNYPLLLASQFLSAFADNFILMVILGPFMTRLREGAITATEQSVANIFYTSLLFVPYVLLAPLAGYLNDRFAKTHWLAGGNLIKLGGAALAALSIGGGPAWMTLGYLMVGIGACI